MAEKIWESVAHDVAVVEALVADMGLPRAACAVLAARGQTTPSAVDRWLQPRLSGLLDPFDLPDMAVAVERLRGAVERQERVLVYGDYDVDGVTSTALMVTVLQALGVTAIPFLPHRVDDGYGLGVEPLERALHAHRPHCVLTVDCGTQSVDAVERARQAGVDVIVTDHHEPGPELAPACAVVNPKRPGGSDEARILAGVGVAFKLAHALLKVLRDAGHVAAGQVDLRTHLDWVALGTIADMVPLQGENRVLARYGLRQLTVTRKAGLQALKAVAGLGDQDEVSAYHVGFLLGPRLNAAGRLGTAQAALDLLLTDDLARAKMLATALNEANQDRQQTEARIVAEAQTWMEQHFVADRDYGVVLAGADWHPGVIGIAASRICAQYSRPTVVIGIDEDGCGRGSCRSVAPFDMVAGLQTCADSLIRFGGHTMAAGLQIATEQIETFRQQFNAAVQARVTLDALRPRQKVDAWITLNEADWTLLEILERMDPLGIGNPKPVWAVKGVRLLGAPRRVGKNHLKMSVLGGNTRLDAIAFGLADRPIPDGPLDIAFQLNRNRFRDRETLQMVVQDFRASIPCVSA